MSWVLINLSHLGYEIFSGVSCPVPVCDFMAARYTKYDRFICDRVKTVVFDNLTPPLYVSRVGNKMTSLPWMKTTSEGTDRGRGGRARRRVARARTRGKRTPGESERRGGGCRAGLLKCISFSQSRRSCLRRVCVCVC